VGVNVGVGLGVKVDVGINVAVGVGVSVEINGRLNAPHEMLARARMNMKNPSFIMPLFFMMVFSSLLLKQNPPYYLTGELALF
jgi:hypothetical protein